MQSGSTTTVRDTAAPFFGHQVVTCNNGTVSVGSKACNRSQQLSSGPATPSTPPSFSQPPSVCQPSQFQWSSTTGSGLFARTNTCNVNVPQTQVGQSGYVVDSTAPGLGNAQFTCSQDGTLTVSQQSACGTSPTPTPASHHANREGQACFPSTALSVNQSFGTWTDPVSGETCDIRVTERLNIPANTTRTASLVSTQSRVALADFTCNNFGTITSVQPRSCSSRLLNSTVSNAITRVEVIPAQTGGSGSPATSFGRDRDNSSIDSICIEHTISGESFVSCTDASTQFQFKARQYRGYLGGHRSYSSSNPGGGVVRPIPGETRGIGGFSYINGSFIQPSNADGQNLALRPGDQIHGGSSYIAGTVPSDTSFATSGSCFIGKSNRMLFCNGRENHKGFYFPPNSSQELGVNCSSGNQQALPPEPGSGFGVNYMIPANHEYNMCNYSPNNQLLTNAPTSVSQVSVGKKGTCFVNTSNKASCFMLSRTTSFGNTFLTKPNAFVPINSSLNFTQVSSGTDYACGVTTSGDIHCWGENTYRTLGQCDTNIGSSNHNFTTYRIPSSIKYKQVSAGSRFACGLSTNGRVYCWGTNKGNQMGGIPTSQTPFTTVPVEIPLFDTMGPPSV